MTSTSRRFRCLALAATLTLVAAACGDDEPESTATQAPTAVPTATPIDTDDDHGTEDHEHEGEDHDGEDHDHDHDGEDHDHDHDHDGEDHDGEDHDHGDEADFAAPAGATEVEEAQLRLIVADGADATAQVVDLATEELLATIELPGSARVVEVGRHVLAAARADDRLEVIDAGTWTVPHGDHFHSYVAEPTLTDLGLDLDDPTHVVDHHGMVAVFNDGDGTVTVIDSHLLGEEDAVVATIDTGAAHHGVAVALEELGQVLATTPVDGEALPDGVAVVDLETGEELERFGDCPELHGEVSTHDVVAFGCADGVLVLEPHGDHWDAVKIDRPADATGDLRTGTLAAGHDFEFLIGNLGSDALVRIDLDTATATTLALPVAMSSFTVDPAREVILVVTIDGQVHRIDPLTGEILQSVAAVDAFDLPTGHGGPPVPSLVVAGDRAYLTDPADGQVVELGIVDELRVARELTVGGTPASVTIAGFAPGGAH